MKRFVVMARFPLLDGEWEQYGKDVSTKAQARDLVGFILTQLSPYQISITDTAEKEARARSPPEKAKEIQTKITRWQGGDE